MFGIWYLVLGINYGSWSLETSLTLSRSDHPHLRRMDVGVGVGGAEIHPPAAHYEAISLWHNQASLQPLSRHYTTAWTIFARFCILFKPSNIMKPSPYHNGTSWPPNGHKCMAIYVVKYNFHMPYCIWPFSKSKLSRIIRGHHKCMANCHWQYIFHNSIFFSNPKF